MGKASVCILGRLFREENLVIGYPETVLSLLLAIVLSQHNWSHPGVYPE